MPTITVDATGLDWLQVVLTIGGFALTLFGLSRTRSAVAATQRRLAYNQLLVLTPQLMRVEDDLDRAIEAGDRQATRAILLNWKWQASQIRGLIPKDSLNYDDVLTRVQESVTHSSAAKAALVDTKRSLAAATKEARVSIGIVTASVAAVTGIVVNQREV